MAEEPSPLAAALERVLLAMIIADDMVDPDEVSAAEAAYEAVTGHAPRSGALETAARDAKRDGTEPASLLEQLPQLQAAERTAVFRAAFAVAGADGFVLEEEDELLQAVGRALDLDDAQMRSVFAELLG